MAGSGTQWLALTFVLAFLIHSRDRFTRPEEPHRRSRVTRPSPDFNFDRRRLTFSAFLFLFPLSTIAGFLRANLSSTISIDSILL